uniref:Putative ovule protein n=1 Tax=Solanum chacoense TaxID=4108 RepID=A0A0V0GPL6_SOLCH
MVVMLKEDIIRTVQVFHSNQVFEKSCNATFIVLLSKTSAADLKGYKPISFVGRVYKIIAKLLAERL